MRVVIEVEGRRIEAKRSTLVTRGADPTQVVSWEGTESGLSFDLSETWGVVNGTHEGFQGEVCIDLSKREEPAPWVSGRPDCDDCETMKGCDKTHPESPDKVAMLWDLLEEVAGYWDATAPDETDPIGF